jgi:Flp pilus assembly protein TadG
MTGFCTTVRGIAARLCRDQKGGIATLTAVSLAMVVGFIGLGTEVSMWYSTTRSMQGASDGAAFTAATALAAGQTSTTFKAAAKAVSSNYGFTDGSNHVTVTVNNPPATGGYTANNLAVEVIISQQETLMFGGPIHAGANTIRARSVALAGTGGNGCVMALDKGDVTDITDSGGTTLTLNSCSLYVNSPSSSALTMSGGATITAQSAYIVGNYTTSGGASLTTSAGTHTGTAAATDPYANVQIPSYSGCNKSNTVVSGHSTLNLAPTISGGIYVLCNGLNISGAGTVNLAPGTYIIDRGSLSVSGGATLAGSGVTIILTSSTGSSYGTAQISGGAKITLSAPTSGATEGLAFFQDHNAPQASSNSFSGGSTQNITGAIYFPNEQVTYSGGTTTANGGAACTQLLAYKLSFSGGSTFNANCSGTGVASIGVSSTKLVE